MTQPDGPRHLEKEVRLYHGEEAQAHHHEKRSMFSKVKEKIRKWKNVLHKKKHGHESNGDHVTEPWSTCLEEYDNAGDEEDPEFHGAPMYESEMAPDIYRDSSATDLSPRKEMPEQCERHQPFENGPAISMNQMETLESNCSGHENNSPCNDGKTLTQVVSEILSPAYAMVSGATAAIASMIQAPPVSTKDEAVAKQKWDKGVSFKDYIMQKLEPGEDDRALSQVISEAISPSMRRGVMDMGVVEKVKGAVPSRHGTEGSPIPVSTMPHYIGSPSSEAAKLQPKMLYSPSTTYSRDQKPVMAASRSMPASVATGIYSSYDLSNPRFNASRAGEIKGRTERTLREFLK